MPVTLTQGGASVTLKLLDSIYLGINKLTN